MLLDLHATPSWLVSDSFGPKVYGQTFEHKSFRDYETSQQAELLAGYSTRIKSQVLIVRTSVRPSVDEVRGCIVDDDDGERLLLLFVN